MKKNIVYILVCFVVFAQIQTIYSQQRSNKRGISYEIPYVEDLPVLSPGVSWYYNWGVAPGNASVAAAYEEYLDFIPMTWNGSYNRTNLRNFLTAHPNVKYILAFNEPNFTAQARMTPTQAAAAWPELEAIADEFSLEIVSPAVNYAPGNGAVQENGVTYTDPWKWLDDFFAACPDCRVDHIAIHCYMNDPNSVDWYVNQFITKYNKPIWLTEFCAWEYNAPLTTEGYQYQRSTMIRKLEQLERNPMVAKYAWFIPRTNNDGEFPYMQLLKKAQGEVAAGELTELGKIYVNMSSFDTTHYFGVNEVIPAKDYIESFWVKMEESTDSKSSIPIQLCEFESGQFVDYLVDVPSAGEYPLCLRIANTAGINPKFKIYSDGTELTVQGGVELTSTGGVNNWETKMLTVNLSAGKQTIRVTSSGQSGCKMQWICFSIEVASIPETANNNTKLKVFVDNNRQLQILTNEPVISSSVFDVSGKVLCQKKGAQEIDISGLNNGMYILQVQFKNGNRISEKFILNK